MKDPTILTVCQCLFFWTLLGACIQQPNLTVRATATTTHKNTTKASLTDDEKDEVPIEKPPPHILFVLIDDLGWGDVGFHQDLLSKTSVDPREIQTPVMDELVREGIELDRHYVHSTCTGTRTSLQSGRFPVHVQTSLKYPEDPSSGMPRNLTGLAEHLKKAKVPYATHYVGKWDVGMATPKHTPKGRGYDTSLNYFEHKNDYWTQECAQSKCCQLHLLQNAQTDRQTPERKQPTSPGTTTRIKDLWDTDRPARELVGTDYEEFIFQRRMLDIIDQHASSIHHRQQRQLDNHNDDDDTSDQPLFLFYAPHVAHCPLQVPQSYLDQFDFMTNDETMCQAHTANILRPDEAHQPPYSCRKQYRAMVKLLDDILGSLVERLKQHGMWENTLMVVTSDNGGPVDLPESGATNYPLRGGKYSDWEGGVRATAFLSGGYLPASRQGRVVDDPIHICDWYATLPALAGIDVRQAEADNPNQSLSSSSRIPPIDAVNIWPIIMDDPNRPRKDRVIPLSANALIIGNYKLLWNEHKNISMAGWTSPDYPNGQTSPAGISNLQMNCTAGCLFNVNHDAGERNDIKDPFIVRVMKQQLVKLREGFFENDDQGVDSCPRGFDEESNDGDGLPCACWMAVNYYGGFLGPYQEVDIQPDLVVPTKPRGLR